ncbi:MAG TPA: CheR family methyltransferase [Terriglobales bacterium]|nr:CheR family methyltransferase [Terriglobales bacterium]
MCAESAAAGLFGPSLDAAVVRVRDTLYQTSGFFMPTAHWPRLQESCERRMQALGIASLREYSARLASASAGEELGHLLGQLSAGERFFFRYPQQLEALRRIVLPALRLQPEREAAANVACIGGGEDAYTLALILAEQAALDGRFHVYACDADPARLAAARRGVFAAAALSQTPPHLRAKYFRAIAPETFAVTPALKQHLTFCNASLAGPAAALLEMGMDVIFCRDLIARLDPLQRRRAVGLLAASLNSHGYLFFSPFESPMGAELHHLRLIHFPAATAYRKVPAPANWS